MNESLQQRASGRRTRFATAALFAGALSLVGCGGRTILVIHERNDSSTAADGGGATLDGSAVDGAADAQVTFDSGARVDSGVPSDSGSGTQADAGTPCSAQLAYPDLDHDGYGDSAAATHACPHAKLIARGGDCNDGDVHVHPDSTETCNSADDDCDGIIDEGVLLRCWFDGDGDGYAAADAAASFACGSCPVGNTTRMPGDVGSTDCDDNAPAVYPGAPEICDGTDYNCNGGSDLTCLCTQSAVRRSTQSGTDGDCDVCDANQTWGLSQLDCNYPTEACDDDASSGSYGQCTANAVVTLGNETTTGFSPYAPSNDVLLAQPIIASENQRLLGFGLTTTASSIGGQAYFGLYADSVNAQNNQHEPGSIINRTDEVILATNSDNFTSAKFTGLAYVQLTKGARYWVVAHVHQAAADSVDVLSSGVSDPAAGDLRIGMRTFGVLGNLAPGATSKVTGRVSVFIHLQR